MSNGAENQIGPEKTEDSEPLIKLDETSEGPAQGTENYDPTNGDGQRTESAPAMVRLRGLPFSAKDDDIRAFFGDIPVGEIKMTNTRDGRPSGECYCTMLSENDANRAIVELDKKSMNSRYIEVFHVTSSEADSLNKPGSCVTELEDRVIRLRGLPYSATQTDIEGFLLGLTCEEVVIGQTGGRPSGEAYVRLATKDQAAQALELNRKMMGSRYVEVFRTNDNDLERHRYDRPPRGAPGSFGGRGDYGRPPSLLSLDYTNRDDYGGHGGRGGDYGGGYGGANDGYGGPVYPTRRPPSGRPGPYDAPRRSAPGGGRYGDDPYGQTTGGGYGSDDVFNNPHNVFMRGIPFDVAAAEIERFFQPLQCYEIKVGQNRENRPSGDAVVTFGTPQDVAMAESKNRQYLGRRYVELFSAHDAPPPMRSLVWKRIGGSGAPPQAQGYGGGYSAQVAYDYSAGAADYQASYAGGYGASAADPYTRPAAGGYGDYAASQAGQYGGSQSGQYGQAAAAGGYGGYEAYYANAAAQYSKQYGQGQSAGARGNAAPPPPPPSGAGRGYSGPAYPGRY